MMKIYRVMYDNPIFTEAIASDSSWTIRQAKSGEGFSVKPCFHGIKIDPSYGKTLLEAMKGLAAHLSVDIDLLTEKLKAVNEEIAELEAAEEPT